MASRAKHDNNGKTAALAVPVPGQAKGQGAILPHRPAEDTQPPFAMDLKRPDKVQFQLEFNKETTIQVFDAVQGRKLRPYLNRKEVDLFLRKK